jgi:hypothetical protein
MFAIKDQDQPYSFTGNRPLNIDYNTGAPVAISAYVETPWLHLPKLVGMGNWERTKTLGLWMVIYAGGEPASPEVITNTTISLTTKMYVDYNKTTVRGTWSTTHTASAVSITCDPKQIQSMTGNGVNQFKVAKFRFENANLDEHFKIHKLVFGFRTKQTVER